MVFRICSSKEEAIQAAEAGLLWLNLGTHTDPWWGRWGKLDVAKHYGENYWKPEDFAVLVEDDGEGDSPATVSEDYQL